MKEKEQNKQLASLLQTAIDEKKYYQKLYEDLKFKIEFDEKNNMSQIQKAKEIMVQVEALKASLITEIDKHKQAKKEYDKLNKTLRKEIKNIRKLEKNIVSSIGAE